MSKIYEYYLPNGKLIENYTSFISKTDPKEIWDSDKIDGQKFTQFFRSLNKENSLNLRPLPLKNHVTLYDHQVQTIKYIINTEQKNNYGLCGSVANLEMGLGKTICAISACLIAPKVTKYPTLIIGSKTVIGMWKTDGFEKFFESTVKVLYFHKSFMSSGSIANITLKELRKYDFVVTSYDLIYTNSKMGKQPWKDVCVLSGGKEKSNIQRVNTRTLNQTLLMKDAKGPCLLFDVPWERVILDESHEIANSHTDKYRSVMALYGRYKLCLTGTPIRNYDTDVWSQLRFCGYNGVCTEKEWTKKCGESSVGQIMMKLHHLGDAIYTLNYTDTNISLPPKNYITKYTQLSETERDLYNYTFALTKSSYIDAVNGKGDYMCVLTLFTRLRQICIAPYLITPESKRGEVQESTFKIPKEFNWVNDIKSVAGICSGKMKFVVELVKTIPQDEKIIIYSTLTSCLDLIEIALKDTNLTFLKMDGDNASSTERSSIVNSFDSENVKGLLMTYKVGSEGINLTMANHVICVEPWYNDSVKKQAIARCWRPGQTKPVYVYNIYAENTIEDRILEICKNKDEMTREFLSDEVTPNKDYMNKIFDI